MCCSPGHVTETDTIFTFYTSREDEKKKGTEKQDRECVERSQRRDADLPTFSNRDHPSDHLCDREKLKRRRGASLQLCKSSCFVVVFIATCSKLKWSDESGPTSVWNVTRRLSYQEIRPQPHQPLFSQYDLGEIKNISQTRPIHQRRLSFHIEDTPGQQQLGVFRYAPCSDRERWLEKRNTSRSIITVFGRRRNIGTTKASESEESRDRWSGVLDRDRKAREITIDGRVGIIVYKWVFLRLKLWSIYLGVFSYICIISVIILRKITILKYIFIYNTI